MFHITLSKGKHIAQGKKERYITKVQVKRTGRYIIRAQVKGTGKYCIKVQVKRTGRYIIRAHVKGTGKFASLGQKTGLLIICVYTNQPRSLDRAYDLDNQSHKTGNNKSI